MTKIEKLSVVYWFEIALILVFSMVRDFIIRSKKRWRVRITPVLGTSNPDSIAEYKTAASDADPSRLQET